MTHQTPDRPRPFSDMADRTGARRAEAPPAPPAVTRREDETTRYLREIRNSVRFIAWAIGITIGLSMAIGIVYAVIITR